ncbi:hypothetical protein IPZ70_02170 [Streptomyces polychromogenes]|nr:hypothetical protein [Streptomyces polychromogenes]
MTIRLANISAYKLTPATRHSSSWTARVTATVGVRVGHPHGMAMASGLARPSRNPSAVGTGWAWTVLCAVQAGRASRSASRKWGLGGG